MPRLKEDYSSAALRHWQDAKALQATRLEAADHHMGIAAECAVKSAIEASGMKPLDRQYQLHIDKLWGQAPGVLNAARFADLGQLLAQPSPFAPTDWSINDRYAATGVLATDIAKSGSGGKPRWEERRDATGRLLRLAGLLP